MLNGKSPNFCLSFQTNLLSWNHLNGNIIPNATRRALVKCFYFFKLTIKLTLFLCRDTRGLYYCLDVCFAQTYQLLKKIFENNNFTDIPPLT